MMLFRASTKNVRQAFVALLTIRLVAWCMFALCFLALGGCGSLSNSSQIGVPKIDVPPAWSIATGVPAAENPQLVLANWWRQFNDPVLASLVADALQANLSVTTAKAALQQARAQRDVTAATLLPALGSSVSANRNRNAGQYANSFSGGLDASWELDVFGGNRSAINADEAAANASAASLGDVQVSVAAEIALDYITLRSSQARLAIANSNLTTQENTLKITYWRVQAGLITTLEAEQARASAAQTKAQIPLLQVIIAQTKHALAVLTGRAPAALDGLLDTSPILVSPSNIGRQLPQAMTPMSLSAMASMSDLALSFPAETLRQRADIRAAEFQVTAAAARVDQAVANRLPKFNLSGSLGLNALTLSSLSSGSSVVGAILANISLPLFDGGGRRALVRVQEAALASARMAYQLRVLTALQEVEDALVALQQDRERLASLQIAADAAMIAATLANQRYRGGLIDFQVVLETQRTQFSAMDGVAGAEAAVSTDYVRLYKALGGGWSADSVNRNQGQFNSRAAHNPL
jgi:multidrug efflux system outer membrane protein